jgi:hypothetical protein
MWLVSLKDKLVEKCARALKAYFEALYIFCEGTEKPIQVQTAHLCLSGLPRSHGVWAPAGRVASF